jgi:hypothetical protein
VNNHIMARGFMPYDGFRASNLSTLLINQYGMQKNGRQLLNKSNSIDPKRWSIFGVIP